MQEYKWASNKLKLNRAIALADGDESKIKELYISFGGLINPGYEEVNNEVEVVADKLAEEVISTPRKEDDHQKKMLNKLITQIAILALRSKRLTGEQRSKVMAVLLDNLGALPIRKVVARDTMGRLIINGRPMEDVDQLLAFRQSLMSYKDNPARKLLADHKKFLAVEMGVHQGLNPEMIEFSKAVLYCIEQDEAIINDILAE